MKPNLAPCTLSIRCPRPSLLWLALTASLAAAGPLRAQNDITALVASITAGTASTQTGLAGATGSSLAGNTYNVNYAGDTLGVSTFTAGGNTYQTTGVQANSVLIQSSGTALNNNVLWYRTTSTATANGVTTLNAAAAYTNSQAAAFKTPNLNVGSDNFFCNSSSQSDGDYNNAERLDSIFTGGVKATAALSFAVFERGTTTGHDGFGIAAITSLDANGKPASYGPLLTLATGSYGGTSLLAGGLNTAVLRNNTNGSGLADTNPSALPGQTLGGVAVNIVTNLQVPAGTTIYGYSLFAADITATTNLVNYAAFPTNTSEAQGGIDLTTYNGILFQAVPEPGTGALVAAAAAVAAGTWGRRRRTQ